MKELIDILENQAGLADDCKPRKTIDEAKQAILKLMRQKFKECLGEKLPLIKDSTAYRAGKNTQFVIQQFNERIDQANSRAGEMFSTTN